MIIAIHVLFLADFSNIIEDSKEKQNNIYFDKVLHKAIIKVDERGTIAAAATGIAFGVLSASRPKNTWEFDRPFLYVVMDKKYMVPLFVGRVVDPKGKLTLSPRNSQEMPTKKMSEEEKDQDHMETEAMEEMEMKPEMAKADQAPAKEDVESMEKDIKNE